MKTNRGILLQNGSHSMRYPEPSSDLIHTGYGIPFPTPSPVNMPQKRFPFRRGEKIEKYLFLSTTELLLQAARPDFVHELPHQARVFILQEIEDVVRRLLKPRRNAPELEIWRLFAEK